MPDEPLLVIVGPQSQGQDFREVKNGNLGPVGVADLQVKLAHGAGGDQAVRLGGHGAADNLLYQGRDDLRIGGREKRPAAAVHEGVGHGLGPQGREDVFHFALKIFLLGQARRSSQGAAVIGDEPQALQAPAGVGLEAVQAVAHQDLHKVDDFQVRGNGAPPLFFQGRPGLRISLQTLLGRAQVVETPGAHGHQGPPRRG